MNAILANWKTTSAGVALFLTGLTGLLHALNPEVAGPDLSTAVASIIGGIGLICGKDYDVSGVKK